MGARSCSRHDAGPEMGGVEEGNEQGAGLRLCVDENGVEWENI